jgi:hypothetical protein
MPEGLQRCGYGVYLAIEAERRRPTHRDGDVQRTGRLWKIAQAICERLGCADATIVRSF